MLLGCKGRLYSSKICQQDFAKYYDALSPSKKPMLQEGHLSQLALGPAGHSAIAGSNNQTPGLLPKSVANIIRWGQQAPKSLSAEKESQKGHPN